MLREGDLSHIIKNEGGTQGTAPPRTDLPPIAKTIPDAPPANWPAFDLSKPSTDYQLQQGLKVIAAMAGHPLPDDNKDASKGGKQPDSKGPSKDSTPTGSP